jgi:hypothetical protein
MKMKRRLRTREEPLALEDKYFTGTLGNLLSLGAAHFRQSTARIAAPRTAMARLIPAAAKPSLAEPLMNADTGAPVSDPA